VPARTTQSKTNEYRNESGNSKEEEEEEKVTSQIKTTMASSVVTCRACLGLTVTTLLA